MIRKTFRFTNLAVGLLLVMGFAGRVAAADQANIGGSWVFDALGGFAAPGSAAPTADTDGISIEQNGNKIKGTLTLPRGGTCPIEGAVDGNNVHFLLKRQTQAGEVDVQYRGTVNGDAMELFSRVVGQTTGTDIHWRAVKQK